MDGYDTRTTAIRGDLADVKLAGRLFAPHYAVPQIYRCVRSMVSMHDLPNAQSRAVSELIYGETFALLDVTNGFAWGYSLHDDYMGHVARGALAAIADAPTHVVHAGAALLFAEPDIKAPVKMRLPMGARLICTSVDCSADRDKKVSGFLATDGGYIHKHHVCANGEVQGDSAEIARRFMGVPYLWGGRSGDGLDCSGLVQIVLAMQGIIAPRDSDQQMAALGTCLDPDAPLQRGDIVFFPGHVGFMTDPDTLIHANAHAMRVCEEPLCDVIARFPDDTAQTVLASKRLG